jgi:DNA-binding FrmR family transcriptional regulator
MRNAKSKILSTGRQAKIKMIERAPSGGKSKRKQTTHHQQRATRKKLGKIFTEQMIESRVRRIAGQVEALGRMVEDGRPCLEITQQIAAARSALGALAAEILKERGLCGGGAKKTAELERIVDAVMKYS